MKFNEVFPLKFYINLERRGDRRADTKIKLLTAGINAERFPAIDSRFTTKTRGYETPGRYALALTQRRALREARRRRADAVLLLEDDVVLHPNFLKLIERIQLPADWGMFYLGCAHSQPPDIISEGLARVNHALDTHAIAVHSSYYDRIIYELDLSDKPDFPDVGASDRVLAQLHGQIPTYAAMPNLAWQAVAKSDLVNMDYSLYGDSGVATWNRPLTRRAIERMIVGPNPPPEARLGLLFLTRKDVNHPEIWRDWIKQAPGRVRVFSHSKEPDKANDFLAGTQIATNIETEWGSIGLVHATRALLKEALEDSSLTHFALLSESCVPVRPLKEIIRNLELDPRAQFFTETYERASELKRERVRCAPQIPTGCWRFQSQWWLLDRSTATIASRTDYTSFFARMFAPDECYFSTVLALEGYPIEDLVLQEGSTWTHWKDGSGSPTSHVRLNSEHLSSILRSNALFARKFPSNSNIGSFGLHLPP
jgi:hypothetical protein